MTCVLLEKCLGHALRWNEERKCYDGNDNLDVRLLDLFSVFFESSLLFARLWHGYAIHYKSAFLYSSNACFCRFKQNNFKRQR